MLLPRGGTSLSLHSFRYSKVWRAERRTDGRTDGFAITISRSACIACWCAITALPRWYSILVAGGNPKNLGDLSIVICRWPGVCYSGWARLTSATPAVIVDRQKMSACNSTRCRRRFNNGVVVSADDVVQLDPVDDVLRQRNCPARWRRRRRTGGPAAASRGDALRRPARARAERHRRRNPRQRRDGGGADPPRHGPLFHHRLPVGAGRLRRPLPGAGVHNDLEALRLPADDGLVPTVPAAVRTTAHRLRQ